MMSLFSSFLLALSAFGPRTATGFSLDLGIGMSYLAEPSRTDPVALGTLPVEVAVVHRRGNDWFRAGVSWMYGASTATDAPTVRTRLAGVQADIARSLLVYDYADIKLGLGAVVHRGTVEREAWKGSDSSFQPLPAQRHTEWIPSVRVTPGLLLHGAVGGGGLEIIPLRIELGTKLVQLAPSVSYCLLF